MLISVKVKNQNLSAYKRIRDLVSNSSKKFYVFANEHHRETFVERESNESSNDRNDRAIRVANKWHNQHLKEALTDKDKPKVVLLTNDRDNLDKAKSVCLDKDKVIFRAESRVASTSKVCSRARGRTTLKDL